uniref:Serpentine receptor class gamma n=1 Tax=Panagrellus redivivus TaxID=6233 RepID=A0A7E4VD51_PANRE
MGPMNVLLTLNRFTAVVFFHVFKRLWKFRRCIFYIIFALLVPIAITGYDTFNVVQCNANPDQDDELGCSELSLQLIFVQTGAMVVCAGICIILTTGSIIATRFNKAMNGNSTASKIERILLLQCTVSSIFFCITIFCNYVYTSTTVMEGFVSRKERRLIKILIASSKMAVEILYLIDALLLLQIR